jgi:hypothetical protein
MLTLVPNPNEWSFSAPTAAADVNGVQSAACYNAPDVKEVAVIPV